MISLSRRFTGALWLGHDFGMGYFWRGKTGCCETIPSQG